MSRIYTSVVTVGDVDIYHVTADPNGVLQARQGSIAISNGADGQTYQNTDGGTTWVNTNGAIRRSYGSVPLTFRLKAMPVGPADLAYEASWGVTDLIAFFNTHFNRCFIDILFADGTRIIRQKFANLTEIVAWINTNVPQIAGTCQMTTIMEVYDLVDPSIEKVTKIWAQNSALGRLIGDDHYWGGNKTVITPSWSLTNEVLKAMFDEAHGFDPFPAPGAWAGNERRCFWISSNSRRRYKSAWENTFYQTPPAGGNGRYTVTAGGVVNPAPGATGYGWSGANPPCMAIITDDGTSYVVRNANSTGFQDQAKAVVAGKSILFGLPLDDGAGNYCLALKAMGVDMFYTNYLDPTRYRIEAVGGSGQNGHQGLRVLPIPPAGRIDIGGNTMGNWNLSTFIGAVGTGWSSNVHGHGDKLGMIRFQVRDLTTDRVSDLSDPCIKFGSRNRYAQLPVLVKNRPR